MGKVAVYTWPNSDTAAICASQTIAAAGNLSLNGTIFQNTNTIPGSLGYISRVISATSTGDHSGINITIAGTYMGSAVTQTITGPAANATVTTTQLYDTITSVSVSGAVTVTGISVGTGLTGQTQWFQSNIFGTYQAISAQVVVTGTINYSFQSTLDPTAGTPLVTTGIVIPQPANANAYQTVMSSQTTSQFAYLYYPIKHCNLIINSSTAGAGSLVFSVLQQGIT